MIVHRDVKEALLARIEAHAREWVVGDPLDPGTRVGALVSEAHFTKVCGYLDQAENIVFGGTAENGFVAPTVVALPGNDHPLAREEIFGPVLSVIEVSSFDEGDISTPFGGYRQSGFGGRDDGLHAHDRYTQVKIIWLDLSDDADEAVD